MNALILCLVLAFAGACAAVSPPCTATIRGHSYSLDSLARNGTTDWTFKSSDNFTYYINVCNNLVSNNPCGNDGPAYQFNPATGECFRLGLTSSEWFGDSYFDTQGTQGVVVMYTEGDSCTSGSRAKISNIFHCDPTQTGVIQGVVSIGQYCHWVVHWASKYGCQQ